MSLQTKQLTANGSNGHHKFILNINEESISTDRNSSSISFSFQLLPLQNGWDWNIGSNPIRYNINIEGTDYSGTITSYVGSGTVTLKTGTQEVWHNSEGKLNMNVRFSVTDPTGRSYTCGNASASTTMPLTNIARSTACPALSGDIESTYNIALNPASSSFTHSLKVNFGSLSGFVNASGALQSTEYKFSNNNINFTIPSSFYSQFSGKSGTGTLTLTTYNGSTKIGEKTAKLTANCLESRCRPSISAAVKDVNQATIDLTGDANKIVKGFSNVLITPAIKASVTSGDTKSTITSKSVDGTVFTTSNVTLNKVNKKDFSITATNSRGFSTTVTVSATGSLVDYFSPIMNANFARIDQTSAEVKLTYSGTFFNSNFGKVANTIALKWYWQEKYANSWTFGGTITPTLNNNNIKQTTINCGAIFDYQKNYRFKLEAIDNLSNGNKEMDVTAGIPNFDFGKEWFEHHTNVYFDKKTIFQAGLELLHETPYLDFHFANASDDFTSRIIEKAKGVLTCEKDLNVAGKLKQGNVDLITSGTSNNWTYFCFLNKFVIGFRCINVTFANGLAEIGPPAGIQSGIVVATSVWNNEGNLSLNAHFTGSIVNVNAWNQDNSKYSGTNLINLIIVGQK